MSAIFRNVFIDIMLEDKSKVLLNMCVPPIYMPIENAAFEGTFSSGKTAARFIK